MRFRGVLFERLGSHGARIERHFDVPWSEEAALELFDGIEARGKDDQQLWSAGLYQEGSRRGNAGIICNTAALLDHDCADVGTMARTTAHLRAQGYAFMVYTSWSHASPTKTPNDLPKMLGPFDCYRVVIPFSRDVTPDEYRTIIPGLFGYELIPDPEKYQREVQGLLVTMVSGRERQARPRGWDPVSSRPTQGYYVPAPHASFELYEGRPLDVEAVLRRPTTASVRSRIHRSYQPATVSGLTALGVLQNALLKQDLGLGPVGFAGWARSTCPSCKDPSPSLTARANGDGVDLHCHAQCRRREILDALGLDEDVAFAAPTDLKAALEEQLGEQAPSEPAVPVDAAVERLEADIDEALEQRRATIVKYPAGTGKSHACAKSITKRVAAGFKVGYSTQEHAVAHETRMKLPPEVRARSVHIHSPLLQVGDTPACQRAEELEEKVFEFGLSLMGKVCPKCPFRDACPALDAARNRARALPDASVVFVSHAGISQVFGPGGRGADMDLIVDEMPSAYTSLEVTYEELEIIARGSPMPSADNLGARLAQVYAKAWLSAQEPGDVMFGTRVIGSAAELLENMGGRLKIRDGTRPHPDEKKLLRAADRVLRLAAHRGAGEHVGGFEDIKDGLWAMLPDACHQALIDRQGVLLSATPLIQALPDFALRECEVTDGAPVRRVMVLRNARGSSALTSNYYDDDIGRRRVREAEPGEDPGIPWPIVDAALVRAREEAKRYDCRKILFVTFKSLADALRGMDGRLGDDVVVAHYGALRGKNDWMEGRPDECSVVYCFGTPRFNMRPTFAALGLHGDAADKAWVAFAGGELAQAEGRLRLPRRTLPCTVFVEGDVAPTSWHPDLVNEVIMEEHIETATSRLEGALVYQPLPALSASVGVDLEPAVRVGPPPEVEVELPSTPEAMDLLSAMNPARRKWLEENVSWLDTVD